MALSASAAPLMLTAKLDSAKMLMGTVNTLRLQVVQDKGMSGEFPQFAGMRERGYATLLNDTIELGANIKADTTEIGSERLQIDYQVPVQVFDSGYYRLPEFIYVAGRDTARSKQLVLTVTPVKVTADDEISPLTPPADPENPSIFDSLPDWLYYWWWLIFVVAALVAGGWWLWKRYKKEGTIMPVKPELPPHVVALQRLERLKNRKLWQSGQEKEFYTLLTDILRTYLDKRFGIKAMEMTTGQIMEKLAEDSSMRDSRQMMRQVLDMADFVKFAMMRPLPDDNVRAFDNAVSFVEATKPVEKPEDSKEDEDPDENDGSEHTKAAEPVKKKGGEA